MFEQPPIFEEKHKEEKEPTRVSGQSKEDEEVVIIHQKREKGEDTWKNVVNEPEKPLTRPMTAATFEEAKAILEKLPKKTIETSPYAPDPILEFDPYDESYEKKSILMLYHDRMNGGHNTSTEDLEFLSKKEQEWNKEITDAEGVSRYFKDNISSKEKERAWEESFGKSPRLFLQEDNLEKLKAVSQEERIFMLAKASRFIGNSPRDFSEYAKVFPEDVEKIKALFINDYMPRDTDMTIDLHSLTSEGRYQDELAVAFKIKEDVLDGDLRKKLFSLSALEIDRIDPELKDLFVSFDYFAEIARKRNIAKEKIPEDFSENANSFFKEYPEASEDFLKILNDDEMSRKRNLKREDILSEKYEELDAEDKSKILRNFLEYTQYAMIFRETFNRPDLKEDYIQKENSLNIKNRYGSRENFNPQRHSFLYPTEYEPVAFGEDTERKHSKDIEEYLNYNPHYKISKIILEEFKNIKSEEEKDQNTKTIVDFWNKNRSPLLLKNACDSLSSQNPSLAASELYNLIRKERGDKDSLLAALYRLELGTMGISEKGMDYLGEKRFNLGEIYNKAEFSAERVTATGAIGIFNEEKELIKFFYLEGLDSDKIKINAKLMDMTLDTLSMGKPDDTDEEKAKKNECLEELKKNYYKITNDKIFTETGVRLNNLSFREQGSFVIYFNEADENAKDELRDFVKEYGEDGIKSFLALEAGDKKDTGRRILEIGQRLSPEVAGAIFQKYSQIISHIEKSKEEIVNMFQEEKAITPEEMKKLDENLLRRADGLIVEFSKEIEKSGRTDDVELSILKQLSRINSENVLFSSIFKTAYESGEIESFSDIKGLSLKIKKSIELSEEDRNNIMNIVTKNYEENPTRLANIKSGIEKSFEGEISTWYLLKKEEGGEDKIISTFRFDLRKDGSFYVASQNVDPEFRNSAIGKAMNEKVLDNVNKYATTVAISKVGDDCSTIHVNHTGWAIEGIQTNEETGIIYYKLMRTEKTRDAAKSMASSEEELLSAFYKENSSLKELLENETAKFIIKIAVDDPEGLEAIKESSQRGYLVTRLIPDKDNPSEIYHLFEKSED